ncbi:MAG: hypothetical protein L0H73_01760 [Nitrococcus sp.]|nr:hypothetical protein [Nitrococcus sp.]
MENASMSVISAFVDSIKPRFAPSLLGHRQIITWTVADQAVVSAANLLTGLFVARYAGISAFGTFSMYWLAVLFVQSLQIAMILRPMLSIGPKFECGEEEGYYAAVFVLQLAFSAIVGLGSYVLLLGGNALGLIDQIEGNVGPLIAVLFCTQVYEFMRRHAFSNSRAVSAFAMDSFRYGVQIAGLLVLFAFDGYRTIGDILMLMAASAVLGLAVFRHQLPSPSFHLGELRRTAKRHWQMSKWMTASALLRWSGSSNFYILVAGGVLGPIAAGALRAAQTLANVTNIFFSAADNFGPVWASKIYVREGRAGLRPFMRRFMLIGGGVTLAASLAVALPAQFWLGLLFGEEFAPYAHLVGLYAVAGFLLALTFPYAYVFLAQENARPNFFGNVAASLVSLVIAYPAIYLFGAVGAVCCAIAAQLTRLAVFVWYHRR